MNEDDKWVIDTERVRGFHGQRLEIADKGIFTMTVREADDKGNKRKGFVQVIIEPWDLDASMSVETGKPPIDGAIPAK